MAAAVLLDADTAQVSEVFGDDWLGVCGGGGGSVGVGGGGVEDGTAVAITEVGKQ